MKATDLGIRGALGIAGYKNLGFIVWIALVGYFFALFVLVRSIKAKSVDAWALFLAELASPDCQSVTDSVSLDRRNAG